MSTVTVERPPARTHGRRGPRTLHVVATLAALVAVLPLIYLVVRANNIGWAAVLDTIVQPRTLELSLRSVGLAAAVAATCMVVGVPLAWLIVRTDVPGGRWWLVVAALPLAIPSYVTASAWVAAIPGFQGAAAAWLVLSASCLPYVVLPVAGVLGRIDPALEDVARTLGLRRAAAFRRVVAPLLLPAAASGGLLTALYVLSDFGAVSLLRFDSFTRVIYTSYRASFDRTTAAVLSMVLVALALVFVLLERRIRTRHAQWRVGSGVAREPQRIRLGRMRWAGLGALGAVYAVSLAFPVAMLVVLTLRGRRDLDVGEWAAALGATVQASSVGAVIAMALAIPIGLLAARARDRWSRAVETTAFLGHALPGVVVGLSLVYLGLTLAPGLYQTLALLGLAYAVLFLSNAIGSVRSAAAQVPPVLEDVSRTLGSGAARTWLRVTAPLTAPGIAAGALLVLLTAMRELPATLMLRPTGMDTLATELWSRTSVGAYAEAAPYAGTLILVAAVPAFFLARMVGRADRSSA